jgi:hypothetical protein
MKARVAVLTALGLVALFVSLVDHHAREALELPIAVFVCLFNLPGCTERADTIGFGIMELVMGLGPGLICGVFPLGWGIARHEFRWGVAGWFFSVLFSYLAFALGDSVSQRLVSYLVWQKVLAVQFVCAVMAAAYIVRGISAEREPHG